MKVVVEILRNLHLYLLYLFKKKSISNLNFFFSSAKFSKIKRLNIWTLSFVDVGKQDRKVWAKCKGNHT